MKTSEELKILVLGTTDLNELYEYKMDLSKIAAITHKELYSACGELSKIDAKGKLKFIYSILTTCQDKIDTLKEKNLHESSWSGCKFISVAKLELSSTQFNKILNKCNE